jgi:hypothetical protein
VPTAPDAVLRGPIAPCRRRSIVSTRGDRVTGRRTGTASKTVTGAVAWAEVPSPRPQPRSPFASVARSVFAGERRRSRRIHSFRGCMRRRSRPRPGRRPGYMAATPESLTAVSRAPAIENREIDTMAFRPASRRGGPRNRADPSGCIRDIQLHTYRRSRRRHRVGWPWLTTGRTQTWLCRILHGPIASCSQL